MSNDFKVTTNKYLSRCDPKDVISLNSNPDSLTSISKLKHIVNQTFIYSGISSISEYIANNFNLRHSSTWFERGAECEILRAGSLGWQKGKIKVKVTLEFIPDEPEETNSPLDDVRQELHQSISEL
jgi:hypothetical protein